MPKESFDYRPHYGLRIEVTDTHTKEKYYFLFGVEHREALRPALEYMIEELDRRVL